MDKKDNDYCAGIDACSIWHHVGLVCGIWRGDPRYRMAGHVKNISYKYWYGFSDSGFDNDSFCIFYDRSQLNIGTILYQLVYSFCVDLFADAHVYSSHLWLNAVIMILGVMLFAVGTGFYASASMGRGSYEALTFSLAEKNHWQVKGVRMILDVLMVIVGVVLGGKFGICAIATILFSGPVIQFTTAKTKKLLAI